MTVDAGNSAISRPARNTPRDSVIERVAFGRTVKHFRLTSNLLQRELTTLIDNLLLEQSDYSLEDLLNKSTVSTWESGVHRPHQKHFDALKELFPDWEKVFTEKLAETHARARMIPPRSETLLRRELLRFAQAPQVAEPAAIRRPSRSFETDSVDVLLPRCWMATNHSNPNVDLDQVQLTERNAVATLVSRHYGNYLLPPYEVMRIRHAQSDDVYYIAGREGSECTLLLKIIRSERTDAQMRALTQIQRKVAKRNIFKEYSEYIKPLATTQGGLWVSQPQGRTGPMLAFRFLEKVKSGEIMHFRGESENDLQDVATYFAHTNNSLAQTRIAHNLPLLYPLDPTRWEMMLNKLKSDFGVTSDALCIARAHVALLQKTFDEVTQVVDPFLALNQTNPITLTDLHPHNVFTMQGRCVLIIDYEEARRDWPEAANVAFATHRFCREFIRRKFEQNPTNFDISNASRNSALAFLRGYLMARPKQVIDEVVKEGTTWAKAINLSKISTNIAHAMGVSEDPKGRTQKTYLEEMNKLISYLMELDEVEKCDWMMLAHKQLCS